MAFTPAFFYKQGVHWLDLHQGCKYPRPLTLPYRRRLPNVQKKGLQESGR